MLNVYHKQRNIAALKKVEEMVKQPASLEQMREQIQRLLSEPEEEESIEAAEEYKRKVFETSPKRKTLLLTLDEFDVQTIVEALDITIKERLSAAETSGMADFGIKRYVEWRDKAMKWHISITTIARQPIINSIMRSLIKPLEDSKNGCSDIEMLKIYEAQIEYYKTLVKKLKFEEARKVINYSRINSNLVG